MGFGANSQKDMQNVALIISSKTLSENDDSAAFDSILVFFMSRNLVK